MSLPAKSSYLPPLSTCLDGSSKLLSWETVAQQLEVNAFSSLEPSFARYIQDPAAVQALANCFIPLKPSSQSKSELETLTSAINVTPTPNNHYDIKEIKEDTLWLSQAVQIDELQSLRLVLLEWQSRPARQALSSIGRQEIGNFGSIKFRRRHLLEIYFRESQWLLRCVEQIIRLGQAGPFEGRGKGSQSDARASIARAIHESWGLRQTQDIVNDPKWLTSVTLYLQKQVDSIRSRSDVMSQNTMQEYADEHLHVLCTETMILRIIHGLQIVLLVQWSLPHPSPAAHVLGWFSWMDTNMFHRGLLADIPFPFIHYQMPISELLILCSLAFIDISASYEILGDLVSSSSAGRGVESRIYLQSIGCIEELNRIFLVHIEANNEIVAPVGIAWFSLLNVIQIHASRSIEHRENRQTQKAIDLYGDGRHSESGDSPDIAPSRRHESSQRRQSFGSDSSGQATLFEEIDELVRNHPAGEDTIKHFGKHAAVELAGFSVIASIAQTSLARVDPDAFPGLATCIMEILLQYVKTAIDMGSLSYSPFALDIISTILAGEDGYWRFAARGGSIPYLFNVTHYVLGDDPLLRNIMTSARGRFPFEGVPFIQLCRTLLPLQDENSHDNNLISDILSNIETFTALVTEPQVSYDLVGEGDHLQLYLLDPIGALAMTFPRLLQYFTASDKESLDSLILHTGTTGLPLRDEKPIIALWRYRYSGIWFCGLTLQLHLHWRTRTRNGETGNEYPVLYALNTEIIALLATWLMKIAAANEREVALDKSEALLAAVSDGLDRNQDIIAIICDLLEGEIYQMNPEPEVARLIFRCLQFLTALAKVMPSRVWSFLGRSGLLGLHGQENRLMAIITATEMSTGTCDILLSAVQLLDVLVENAALGLGLRHSTSMMLKRFRASDSYVNGSATQNVTVKKITQQFIRIIIDVFEVSSNWNFQDQEHKLSLTLGVLTILHKLISYTSNYDDESSPESRLSADIAPSASYVVDSFLSDSANDMLLQPFFQDLKYLAGVVPTSVSSRIPILRQSVALSSINLFAQLVRLNRLLGHPTSKLTKKLHEIVPVLVDLFVLHSELRLSIVHVLKAAICDSNGTEQPVPILGALSEASAKAFIQCLSTLGLSAPNSALPAATWSLFSAALAQNQQWFTVYLLLGKTPKETLKSKGSTTSQPMIYLALKKLRTINDLNQQESMKLLEFVARSANLWPSVVQELRNDKECKDICLKYLNTLQQPAKDGRNVATEGLLRFQIATYIVNILALLAYHANQRGDTTTIRHIIPNVKFLVEHGASTPSYNASLHHGLQKNFEELFSGSSLQHFKRTSFSEPTLGERFYYDTLLADKVFDNVPAWRGKGGKGFANEFTRANINLSLVEVQVNLFHSWKSLAMELSEGLSSDSTFQATMISIIKNCLGATINTSKPEPIFKKLRLSQADLAFSLLQKLVEVAPKSEGTKSILNIAWSSTQLDMGDLASSLVGEGADFARMLVRILYLALCAHESSKDDNVSTENALVDMVLNILEIVVAQGFRSLTAQLHEDSNQVKPQDFALIIAILRTSLNIPGVQGHSERLLAHFVDDKTIQRAGSLISWSDQMTTNGDPVYGELGITFLLELSAVQVLAEAMVVGGIFSQISSTTLFSHFRRNGGFGPFENPPRMYDIWTSGYLPLALNIIGAIGSPVAVEIATIFEQFSPQLKRASTQLDPKLKTSTNGRVTLSMMSEAHSLALLSLVLSKFRIAGSTAGIVPMELPQLQWDAPTVREDLESLLGRRQYLRDCITPTNEREEYWSQQRPLMGNEGSQNQLEARIVAEIKAVLELLGSIE